MFLRTKGFYLRQDTFIFYHTLILSSTLCSLLEEYARNSVDYKSMGLGFSVTLITLHNHTGKCP